MYIKQSCVVGDYQQAENMIVAQNRGGETDEQARHTLYGTCTTVNLAVAACHIVVAPPLFNGHSRVSLEHQTRPERNDGTVKWVFED